MARRTQVAVAGALMVLFSWVAGVARAESAYDRELKRLIDQRDREVAAAVTPIQKRFQVAAEQLMRRAMQAGDLDAANKIKAQLAAPVNTAETSLQKLIENSRWDWFNSAEPVGAPAAAITFNSDGTGLFNWGDKARYEISPPSGLKVMDLDHKATWYFIIDPARKEAKWDPVAGADSQQRSMKRVEKVPIQTP